jgi:AcrR family transcriptional regulator
MPTQAERVAASDRALIAAAVQLIAERGYDRTTLAAIGDASGYSRALVTRRFGSKEGLLRVVLDQLLSSWRLTTARPRVGGRVGIPAIKATIDAFLEVVEHHPESIRAYYALLFEASGPLREARDAVVELHREERDGIARWIRAGQRDGTIREDIDVRAAAAGVLGVIRGTTMQWLLDPAGVDIVATLTEYAAGLDRMWGTDP